MAKKKTGGFVPPPEIPDERKCIQIYIPNDVYDRGAFWGALWELTFSYNWQSFSEGQSRLMADLWRDIWTEAYERSNGVNCCNDQPVLHRFDPVTGYPQVSYDNGTTWVPDPASIQNQIQLYPPLVGEGSSSTKCDAATNASEHVNELITATGENLNTAATVFELAVGVAAAVLALFLIIVSAGALTAPVTAVATAIWAAATGAFELGIAGYNAYWTADKQDAILCAIFCNIGENGQFTEAQYQAFRTKVKSTLPASPALDIVMTAINAGGAVGMSQMASYGNAALADCGSCTCDDSCNIDMWSIWNGEEPYGSIVSTGDGFIVLDLQLAPATVGEYYVRMKTPSIDQCCVITGWEVVSGGTVNISAGGLCGTEQTGGGGTNITPTEPSGPFNRFAFASTGAARIKVTFTGA